MCSAAPEAQTSFYKRQCNIIDALLETHIVEKCTIKLPKKWENQWNRAKTKLHNDDSIHANRSLRGAKETADNTSTKMKQANKKYRTSNKGPPSKVGQLKLGTASTFLRKHYFNSPCKNDPKVICQYPG